MSDNLPDDVSPSDIDKHFGTPDRKEYVVGFTATVDVGVEAIDEDHAERGAVEKLHDMVNGTPIEVFDETVELVERL